jgi:hypothetical protein
MVENWVLCPESPDHRYLQNFTQKFIHKFISYTHGWILVDYIHEFHYSGKSHPRATGDFQGLCLPLPETFQRLLNLDFAEFK